MPTDEERIAAVKDMTPQELNIYVAMNLTHLAQTQAKLARTQEECNEACQARLRVMEGRVSKFDGWLKGLWLITGGLVAASIAAWWRTQK